MALSEENTSESNQMKKFPHIVRVNKNETDSFMNDILKETSMRNQKQKSSASVFIKTTLFSFFMFALTFIGIYIFYLYARKN
jgi:hypothetical protein